MFLLLNRKSKTIIHDKRDFSSRLKCLLGFRPGNLLLFEMAFIHRSASYLSADGTRVNNERLEYLGDAIINSIVSDYLFHLYPDAREGFLTKTRARIVSREMLNNLALEMNLDALVVSNMSSSGASRNLFGNALEALVGALFIDAGYAATRRFFITRVLSKYIDINDMLRGETDYKSLILEYGQKNKFRINFVSSEITDPATQKTLFSVNLEINETISASGSGNSKKEAEQEAAMKAWSSIHAAG